MARKITIKNVELQPLRFGGYLGRVNGRSYRFVERGRVWQARAPTFPGLGRVRFESASLRGVVLLAVEGTP